MRRILVFILTFALTIQAQAAALPAYSPKFGNSMAGVIQQKVVSRGFAANDPRFIATENAIGAALTATATGLAAAAGAPLWATIAIGAATAGAVSLGIGALSSWLFNSDGTVTPSAGPSPVGALSTGGYYYNFNGFKSSSAQAAAQAYYDSAYGGNCSVSGSGTDGGVYTFGPIYCGPNGYYSVRTLVNGGGFGIGPQTNYQGTNCAAGQVLSSSGSCVASSLAPPPPVTSSPAAAVANVPDSDMQKPANPQLVAQAVNNAWQHAAAQPGYQGLPFVASDPVTPTDVQNWANANPSAYPTVSDMLAPAVNPATSTVAKPVSPGSQVQPGVDPGIATAPAGSPQVNLGTDPAIPFPSLETTPTAQMILNPLLNLFPSLKSFVVPSHSSVCPKPSMMLWGKSLVLQGHCDLLETVRPTLYAVMAAVWVMVALFIILAA